MYLRYQFILALLMSGAVGACAVNPTKHKAFDESIADRALEINDAYYAELNGQILKNILRARDRQPRFYTSLSDLSFSPHYKRTSSGALSGVNLGNPTNPWGVLGMGNSEENFNQLSLTVSPKATKDGGDGQSIYHSPLSVSTFLTYYYDWDRDIVDNLLIDHIRKIDPGKTSGGENITSAILNDSDGHFQVLLSPGLNPSNAANECNLTRSCQTMDAYYCLDTQDCQPETIEDKTSYNLSSQKFATIRSYGENLNTGGAKKIDTRKNGALFLCQTNNVNVHSALKTNLSRSQNKGALLYDCRLASSSASNNSSGSLTYVGDLGGEYGGVGMYTFYTSSIDNMIFKVGNSLRYDGDKWTSKIKVDNGTKTFFSVYTPDDNTCDGAYAARIKHHDKTYMAGPPEAKGTLSGACHVDDSSGTVLTLIGELIKLKEVNAELQTSSFLINN